MTFDVRRAMKHASTQLTIALVLSLTSGQSLAFDIQAYEALRKVDPESTEGTMLRMFVFGVGEGLGWANARLEAEGDKPLFCAPRAMSLNIDNYLRFIDEALANQRSLFEKTRMPIEGILLEAMVRKLPCR